MKKQIARMSVFQTSKILAFMYFVVVALICVPLGLWSILHDHLIVEGVVTAVVLPILAFVVYFILNVVVLFFYNLCASCVGGVEFTLVDVKEKE